MNIRGYEKLKNQKGATAVYVAVVLVVLFMFTALGIDVGHLYGVRNELHNAADAAALAGAANLFDDVDGSLTRQAAIDEAMRIAASNRTGNRAVADAEITVETGHWSFLDQEFTPNPTDTQMDWQELSFSELDGDINFINAVRVRVDREDTPSFFAGIFGYKNFWVNNDAVAYIGFAGTLYPGELDQPIAICKDAITEDGKYTCNMGRMLNSGGNTSTSMTAMWTNYSQPCSTANNSDMQGLTKVCSTTNSNTITFGEGIGSQNGVQDNILGNVSDCWEAAADSDGDDVPDSFWPLTLPVIECGVDNTCAPLVGAVKVNVVWIQHKNDPITQMDEVPTIMEDWSCTTTVTIEDRFACWKDFVDHFNLENANGPPVTDQDYKDMYQKKNIFFLPDCSPHEPSGNTGGQNFGILARIPKLVE